MKETSLWFWSDPHFFHKNVIRLCNRPFANLTEMHEELIRRYNSRVGPDDTCIWVGDCFFSKNVSKCRSIMGRLNGRKILIRGNHDHSSRKMLEIGFDSVQDSLWIRVAGKAVQISHYPFQPPKWKFRKDGKLRWWFRLFNRSSGQVMRYVERRPNDIGQYLIHGHTHSSKKFTGRSIHVGVDAHDFYPVSFHSIAKHIKENS